jgi:superfamily II DNA/RNA helicase
MLFSLKSFKRLKVWLQVSEHMQAIAKPCGIWVVPIVGGIAIEKQQRYLRSKPEIVVATPGRLWELMRDGAEHLTDMRHLSFLVLDEADRMVQQGHYEVSPPPPSRPSPPTPRDAFCAPKVTQA